MRILSYLTVFIFSLFLAACGGGGGSPGVGTGSNSTFKVVAPASMIQQVGLLQKFAVSGGVKPYSVVSNDPAVATGWIGGDDVLYVGTVVAGTATITVSDASGSRYSILVTSGSSTPLYTTAASSLTITPGVAYAQTYTIGGGTRPYTATSSFPSAVTVTVNGNQMTITGVQISAAGSVITIRDAAGATLPPISVTPGTVPLAVNPKDVKLVVGTIMRSVITGGTPPYRTIILDACLIDVKILQGNILQAKANMACTGSAVTVVDANNQTVGFNVTIEPGTVGLQLAPSALTVPESTNTPDLQLLVYGANEGSLNVFTTHPSMLAPKATKKNEDGTWTITLSGGDTCVTFIDRTVPRDGEYNGVAKVPPEPGQPEDDVSTNNKITITVVDSTGRQGSSVITIGDNGLNGKGCTETP